MDKDELLHLKILSIRRETKLAKTYELEVLNRSSLRYRPGQFLTFLIELGQEELRRSYSILSIPGEPLKITVKKVDNGEISRHILLNWKEDEVVYALEPTGRFTLKPVKEIKRDIFCFAAGSGIIPILPQIRTLLVQEPESIVHLIYSNRHEEDALFLQDIESLAKKYPKLRVRNFFSDPLYRLSERGRLSNLSTEPLINNMINFSREDAVFLICGPFTYMRMLRFTLGLMHFTKANILKENYSPEIMKSTAQPTTFLVPHLIKVKIKGQVHQFVVDSGKDILTAAIEKGVYLPYSCRGGVCGSCAGKCRSGKVAMTINEVLTDRDISEGWVLSCTGHPEDDSVVLDFEDES